MRDRASGLGQQSRNIVLHFTRDGESGVPQAGLLGVAGADADRDTVVRKDRFTLPYGLDLVANLFENIAADFEQFRSAGLARKSRGPVLHFARDPAIEPFERSHKSPNSRAAATIAGASGAADVPPYCPFSTSIAKAICFVAPRWTPGARYGAKPMNQACDTTSPPSSAVPVFPAIGRAAEFATRPVPEVTT